MFHTVVAQMEQEKMWGWCSGWGCVAYLSEFPRLRKTWAIFFFFQMFSLKIVSHTQFWVTNFRSSFYKELCSPNTHKHTHTTHSCTSIMNIQRQDVRLHWQFFHAKSPYCSPRWDKYRHNLVALIFCLSLCVWIQSVGSYNHLFDHTVMVSASSANGTKNGLCGKIIHWSSTNNCETVGKVPTDTGYLLKCWHKIHCATLIFM